MEKMKRINSPWALVQVFLVTAIIMGVYECIKELIFHGALSPWESHGMTIFITSVTATIATLIVRNRVNMVALSEKQLEVQEQSLLSFRLVLSAVNHIINNALNYTRLIKIDLESDGKVKDSTISLLEASLKEAEEQMNILNRIQEPGRPESYREIFPS